MSESSNDLSGAMAGSVANAKARFAHIDPERLRSFLLTQTRASSVELSPVSYPTGGAGSTNGIGFFSASIAVPGGVLKRDLVVRYLAPGGTAFTQKSMADEFKTIQAVRRAGLAAPNALWLDADGSSLGFAAFVMERVEGETPSAAMYSNGPLANATPGRRKAMMLEAAAYHGKLRAASLGPKEVPHLVRRGKGSTAIERELTWWLSEALSSGAPEGKLQLIQDVYSWMVANQPRNIYAENLVHGDAQIANMILKNGKVAAAIDWELSYLGHNEADLALIVAITETQKILDKPAEGTPTESEYISRFEAESGHSVEHWEFFTLFNAFKVQSVMLLVATLMPAFEQIWDFYRAELDKAWNGARKAMRNAA